MVQNGKFYLDYAITDNYSKYNGKGDASTVSAAYNYIDTSVWIKEQWLCDLIEKKSGHKFYPEVVFRIGRNVSIEIRNLLTSISNDKLLIGTYGDHFE